MKEKEQKNKKKKTTTQKKNNHPECRLLFFFIGVHQCPSVVHSAVLCGSAPLWLIV
jgi:hypothetical protein